MRRILPRLALAALVAGTGAPAGATIIRSVPCGIPEIADLARHAEVFVGELYGVHEDVRSQAARRRSYLPRSFRFRFRFGVVTRYQGEARGVVEVEQDRYYSPTLREGQRYLVLADPGSGGQLLTRGCGFFPVDRVVALIDTLAPQGKDQQRFLRAARKARAARLAEAKQRVAQQKRWEQRVARRLAEQDEAIRGAITHHRVDDAFEAWGYRRELERELSGKPARLYTPAPAAVDSELLTFLLVVARQARAEHDFVAARRTWTQALQIAPEDPQARAGLTALEAEAEALFQAAYARRAKDRLLALAGLREVLLLTSGTSALHQRALRLLRELEQEDPP